MTLLSAKAARSKALISKSESNSEQLAKISEIINRSIEIGEFKTYFYNRILMDVRNELTELGYTVEDLSSQKDGTCYLISW